MKSLGAILFGTFVLMGFGVGSPLAEGAAFRRLGEYYANSVGPTTTYVRLPGNDGEYRNWLSWGYDIWGDGTEPVPEGPAWIKTENLHLPPYNVPDDATAVRLHFKVKATGVTWHPGQVDGALQVKARPSGSTNLPNEMVHATTQKPAGFPTETPYDLNHIEEDIPLGPDGRIEIYRYPSIVGEFMQLDLIVYLSGYWR